ncbi:MarR family winged helix-turn-helix transcriptional regulator [Acidovorax sp. ST3]|uniref:MarR family winged helix-turn-helix transcriptional regulator n=1 Tax=Acidovorax sp. ST3 TaxID=2219062 RepID=UPI000DA6877B|nr:MarR family winged helix-turn-helix transcriptional regulator [Acidovorax sp. ST3]
MHQTAPPADVFEAMHDLMHVYRSHMVRAIADIHPELTMNEVRALSFVGRRKGATQKDLVRHSGADKAQVARMVAQLVERGWITSTPNPEDGRSRTLALSPEGLTLQEAVRGLRQEVSAQLLAGCDAKTQTQLLTLLEKLRDDLNAVQARSPQN